MKIDANDPKWTAYALGELTDENERAEIESLLEESGEMRRVVEDIRQTAGLLRDELHAEQPVGLTQAQREHIEKTAAPTKGRPGSRSPWVLATAAAAVLLLSVVAVRHIRQLEPIPQNNQIASVFRKDLPQEPQRQPAILDESETFMKSTPNSVIPSKADAPTEADAKRHSDLKKTEGSAEAFAPSVAVRAEPDASTGAVRSADKLQQPSAVNGDASNAGEAKGRMAGREAKTDKPISDAAAAPVVAGTDALKSRGVPEEKSKEMPVIGTNLGDLTKVTGGGGQSMFAENAPAAPALMGMNTAQVNVQREGLTANEVRFGRPWPMPPRRKGMPPWQRPGGDFNTEAYENIQDNPFLDAAQNPLSTFSVDVDTASYSNVRRFLEGGSLPPKDAVRIEELVNYFDYDYKGPKDGKPFAVNFEITEAPWKREHRLLRIGLKAREVAPGKRPDSNLVFLIDVSGSMTALNKLPLVKESMRLLVDQLSESDSVAIVVYASDTSVFLPATSGDQKEKLRHAIERLHAGGSTNGASGIQLAYKTAKENFIKGGINRVILATDGDFNVGITNRGDLTRLIEEKADSGIFLSALGFGMGNYKDSTLELLANKGRGNYAYIDTLNEAKKVLVEQINSTLVPVAKDVKLQVEFNPQRVSSYRLIGYEDRLMAKEDFNDDEKQAGVVGAGHSVTALYEIVPVGVSEPKSGVDPLKYQKPAQPSSSAKSDELLTVKIRSKEPDKDRSVLSEFAVKDSKEKFSDASGDFQFAAAVAAFGMALRDSPYKGSANLESALEWAKAGKGEDRHGYRQEFIRLIHRAISISD